MNLLQKAILKTIIYADIFDYPLTLPEIWKFLISFELKDFTSAENKLLSAGRSLKQIRSKKDFFFLGGKEKLVTLRDQREKWSLEKTKLAESAGKWLKLIPWIKMVGITGGLAMENAKQDDDIDLIIITGENRLWLTRLSAILLTELLGIRRRPNEKNPKNKICLNMFLDEKNMAVPQKEKNLFTAHEVCQIKLLWERDDAFKRFTWLNQWAKEFLPNAIPLNSKFKISNLKFTFKTSNLLLNFLEKIAFKLQLAYMRPRKTIEKVERGRVLFHPEDCSGWVLKEYYNKVKESRAREGSG